MSGQVRTTSILIHGRLKGNFRGKKKKSNFSTMFFRVSIKTSLKNLLLGDSRINILRLPT